ncbi:probable membrane-associated kinase regulator 3 [Solanum dulcamara]|uniref:probable membrane-associated kinase regulator 3 n=1 Tax=Solanum dulcamara TaxID=45834 RepID=UPI0024857B6B|nr:probable membrane-associated kinase regulator 3 [Solanum dulcamara]
MAINPLPSSMEHSNDEEYIDIEVNSCSYFSSCPNSSSPQNREFEFQMASITNYNKESTTSPADELFYRGRLLPLHQKILQTELFEDLEDSFCINFLITPIGSPSQTCNVSFELNPNDHKISPKKLWTKFIKHSLINQKFKSSREFLKSLFSKSYGNCCSSKDMKVSKKKTPLKNTTRNNIELSLSSIKWQPKSRNGSSRSFSSTNSSSTGDSFSSSNWSFNSNNEFNFLKRSSSDIEGSIEAAVAHCKKSQELHWLRK